MSGFSLVLAPGRFRVLSGDLSAWDLVEICEGWDGARGMVKRGVTFDLICNEIVKRKGGAGLRGYVATWSGTGFPLSRAWLWFRQVFSGLVIAVRRSLVVKQAAFCARCQGKWGAGAVREADSHAEVVVLVGDGWSCTVRGSLSFLDTKEFNWFELDFRREVALAHVQWFDGLRSFGAIHRPVKQLSLASLVSEVGK